MSDTPTDRSDDLVRRLDRMEKFLAERWGYDAASADEAAIAARLATLAEPAAASVEPASSPAVTGRAMPPPMPVRPSARPAPPFAAVVARDGPTVGPGPQPALQVAEPLEPHVPDDRGYPIPAADFDRIYRSPASAVAPLAADVPQAPAAATSVAPYVPDDRGSMVPLAVAARDPLWHAPLTDEQVRAAGFDPAARRAAAAAWAARGAATSSSPPAMLQPRAGGFEQLVGLKLAGWVGAIVLVIGAALGVKFAYDQGWLGGVPDSVRLGFLYAISLAIVGCGELVYRRVGHLASVGVFGAGIACLFVVGYAGDAYFNLYGQRVAFALMAGASAIGAIVAWRAQLASIAVLSLIGANLAPALLGDSAAGETTLLVYLLALQALALVLAHFGRGDRWWSLRTLSLITTTIWVFVRLADAATIRSPATVGFTIGYMAIFQIEAALAARRATPTWPQRVGAFGAFSTSVTAVFALCVLGWTEQWPNGQRAAIVVGLAMLALVAGAAGVSWRAAPHAFRNLAVAWLGQGLALVALAVPIAFDGPAVLVGWLALALVYAAIGFYARRPGTSTAGAIVWAIAVLDFAFGLFDDLSSRELFHVGGVPVTQALACGVAIGLVGHAIALMLYSRGAAKPTTLVGWLSWPIGAAMPAIATVLVAIVAQRSLPPLPATVAFALIAWATLTVAILGRRRDVAVLAVVVAAFALGKWLLVDVLDSRLGGRPLGETPFLNATFLVGAIVASSGVALTLATARRRGVIDYRPVQIERLITVGIAIGAIAVALCVECQPAARQLGGRAALPVEQLALLAQTALATLLFLALPPLQRAIAPLAVDGGRFARGCGWLVVVLAAKFVVIDSLAFAFDDAVWHARPLVNLQAAVAAVVVVALVLVARRDRESIVARVASAAVAVVPLVAGSIELSRAVGHDRALVALSIFWAAYASVAIAVGFALRGGVWLRVGGLALLAITIGKVVLVDLASAGTGWRILSFLAVGALLLATSVLYGKFGARLLHDEGGGDRGFDVGSPP